MRTVRERVVLTAQISPQYLPEAPWPAAQQCLQQLRAHKNPEDKMRCIVQVGGRRAKCMLHHISS